MKSWDFVRCLPFGLLAIACSSESANSAGASAGSAGQSGGGGVGGAGSTAGGFQAGVPAGNVDESAGAGAGAGAPGAGDDMPSPSNPLRYCEEAVATGEDPRIDDFDDLDMQSLLVEGRDSFWFAYGDETPGGVLSAAPAQVPGASPALHVQSSGWADFGSGVGVVMRWTSGASFCTYDATYYDGLTFWARGSGDDVRMTLTSPDSVPREAGGRCAPLESCYDSHGQQLELTQDWKQYWFAFSALDQEGWGVDSGELKTSELSALLLQMGPSAEFDFWLDDVAFYKGSAPGLDAGALNDAGVFADGGTVLEADASTPGSELDGGGAAWADGGAVFPDASLNADGGG